MRTALVAILLCAGAAACTPGRAGLALAIDEHDVYAAFARKDSSSELTKTPRGREGSEIVLHHLDNADCTYGPSIDLDELYLYFTVKCAAENPARSVSRIPKAGGPVERLVEGVSAAALALGRKDIFWTREDGVSRWSLVKTPKEGGENQVIVQGLNRAAIKVHDELVYFFNETGISRASENGDVSPVVYAQVGNPIALAVDATRVYWLSYTRGIDTATFDGDVMSATMNGGEPQVLASNLSEPVDITTDERYVYWTNLRDFYAGGGRGSGSAVLRMPLEGGDIETIAENLRWVSRIAVDPKEIVWLGSGPVQRAEK